MLRLDTTTRKLQVVLAGAVATNELPCMVSYSDKTATDYSGGSQFANTSGATPVDICAAPAASTVRDIDGINIRNADTAAVSVTLTLDDNATPYVLLTVTLQVGDTLVFTHSDGWKVLNADGAKLTSLSAHAVDITFTPTGDIAATDVQTAIAELDTEKAPIANPTFTGTLTAAQVIAGDPGLESTGINILGTTYESTFKVSDIDGTNYAQTILHRHSTTFEPIIVGARSNSDTGAHAAVTAGQNLLTLYGVGHLTSYYGLFGSMSFSVGTGTVSDASSPGRWTLSLTPNGSIVPVAAVTVYQDGTSNFANSIGIGGGVLTASAFRIARSITGGSTAYGAYLSSTIQSDVTLEASGFVTAVGTQAASFTLATFYHFRAYQSSIGAGSTVTNQYGFHVTSNLVGATNNYGFYGAIAAGSNRYNLYMAGTADNYLAGVLGVGAIPVSYYKLRVGGNITGNAQAYGVVVDATVQSDVTTDTRLFVTGVSTAAAAFTIANIYHFIAGQSTIGAGSTVTNQYGFYTGSTLTGATNNYGFYGNIAAGSNRYNLYMAGTASNYLAGALGIGSAAALGIIALRISTPLTGATVTYGLYCDSQVRSDVTAAAQVFVTFIGTQATAFTLTHLRHYYASQGTIGAGSTVTNQYGFYVESTLTGATNNYGFYGNIAAGSNRYNLYMAGTAQNYLAGVTGIGNTPSSSAALVLPTCTTTVAPLRIPHGTAPTSPVDGDIWTTTAGLYVRINGSTIGPLT